jgi:hypothetical protein
MTGIPGVTKKRIMAFLTSEYYCISSAVSSSAVQVLTVRKTLPVIDATAKSERTMIA